MIGFEHVFRVLQIEVVLGLDGPGHLDQPVEVIADHPMLG